MIRCFRKSLIAVSVVMALMLLLDVYVIFIKSFTLAWTRPLSVLIITAAGIFSARIAGNIASSAENTKILGKLFHEMKPEEFITAYSGVAAKARKGSFDRFSAYAYLADGYSAAGKPEEAIRIIDEAFNSTSNKENVRAFYLTNRLRYQTAAGNFAKAREEIGNIMSAIQSSKPVLRANIEKNILPIQEFLGAYFDGKEDYSALEDEMNYGRVLTTKLESASLVSLLRKKKGKSTGASDRILALFPGYKRRI